MVRSRGEVRETLEAGEVELVDQETVLEYRKDLRRVMEYGSVMERRGVMKSFIQQVEREESHVTVHYVLPLPPEKVPDLQPGVLDTGLPFTEDTTEPFSGISCTFFPGIKLSSGMGTL